MCTLANTFAHEVGTSFPRKNHALSTARNSRTLHLTHNFILQTPIEAERVIWLDSSFDNSDAAASSYLTMGIRHRSLPCLHPTKKENEQFARNAASRQTAPKYSRSTKRIAHEFSWTDRQISLGCPLWPITKHSSTSRTW
jgi:hypothetical protein